MHQMCKTFFWPWLYTAAVACKWIDGCQFENLNILSNPSGQLYCICNHNQRSPHGYTDILDKTIYTMEKWVMNKETLLNLHLCVETKH